MNKIKTMSYTDTFLYSRSGYEKKRYEFFVQSRVVDKNDQSFDDIRFMVRKAQTSSAISKVLDSNNVILLKNNIPLPRSFKVFAAKDIKSGDNKTKVFIDVSEIIKEVNGEYKIDNRDIDKLISYLLSAMSTLIYFADASRLVNNSNLIKYGTKCYSLLFTYIIDYLRIGGVDKIREKCLYLSAIFYQYRLLGKDAYSDSVTNRALTISKLNKREAEIIDIQYEPKDLNNIETFVNCVSKIIKADTLKIDNFIDKWMYLYGSGTAYATELYTSFSTMITDAYTGAYLNNQKQIEKICGRDMVDYTNALLRVGSELA